MLFKVLWLARTAASVRHRYLPGQLLFRFSYPESLFPFGKSNKGTLTNGFACVLLSMVVSLPCHLVAVETLFIFLPTDQMDALSG